MDDAFITLAKDIKARLIDAEVRIFFVCVCVFFFFLKRKSKDGGDGGPSASGSSGGGAQVLSGDDLKGGSQPAKKDSGCCK